MPKNLRSLAVNISAAIANVFGSPLKHINNLPIEISLIPESKIRGVLKEVEPLIVQGRIQEIKKTSLSFVVPFIRLGEQYLVGHGVQKLLKVAFELPNGKVRINVAPTHYEMIDPHNSVQQYVITARITQINDADKARYEDFLKRGNKAALNKQSSVELSPKEKKNSALSVASN